MFAKITNGAVDKFPYSVGQLRQDNPNTSFPKQIPEDTLIEFGMVPVTEVPAPEFNSMTHFAEWGPVPVLEDDVWVLLPTVREYSKEQLAERDAAKASEVRSQRAALLAETDWMGMSDVAMPPKIVAYRQALRTIPNQAGFPHNITWPIKPV